MRLEEINICENSYSHEYDTPHLVSFLSGGRHNTHAPIACTSYANIVKLTCVQDYFLQCWSFRAHNSPLTIHSCHINKETNIEWEEGRNLM